MKKNMIIILIISMMLFPFRIYAEDTVTPVNTPLNKERLQELYIEFIREICSNSDDYDIIEDDSTTTSNSICDNYTTTNFVIDDYVSDDKIVFPEELGGAEINYSINDNGKIYFSQEAEIHNGMTLDEYEDVTSDFLSDYLGLLLIAMHNGATFEESINFIGNSLIDVLSRSLFGSDTSLAPRYMIINDDVESISTDNNILVIKESEVPSHIIEIAETTLNSYKPFVGPYYMGVYKFNKIDDDNAKISMMFGVEQNMDLNVIKEIAKGVYNPYKNDDDETDEEDDEKKEKTIIDEGQKNSVDPVNQKNTGTVINPKTSTTIALISVPILLVLGYILKTIKFKKRISKI